MTWFQCTYVGAMCEIHATIAEIIGYPRWAGYCYAVALFGLVPALAIASFFWAIL